MGVRTLPFASLDDLQALADMRRDLDGIGAVDAWLHARIPQERYQFTQLPPAGQRR